MIRSEVVTRGGVKEKPFPKLMVDKLDGQIMLCTRKEQDTICGFMLTECADLGIGREFSLLYNRLSDFTGTIQLSNE